MTATSRLIRITSGGSLIVAGAVMLVLPGPGVLSILAGLRVLRGVFAPPTVSDGTASTAPRLETERPAPALP